jgi:hypothetical protein
MPSSGVRVGEHSYVAEPIARKPDGRLIEAIVARSGAQAASGRR